MERLLVLLSLLLVLLTSGCSSELPRYPVTGTVSIDGAPAGLTTVKFVADGTTDPTYGGFVLTGTDGTFTIGEKGKNTGLPLGTYKVIFTQTVDRTGKPIHGSGGKASEAISGEREAVADEFRDPKTTPISATITRDNKPFTFEVKKKK